MSAETEDLTLSGGLACTESDDGHDSQGRLTERTDEESERRSEVEEEAEEDEEEQEGQADEEDEEDSSAISSEDSDFVRSCGTKGDGGTPQDNSSSARSTPARRERRSWILDLQIPKTGQPSASINRAITTYLKSDLRLADFHPVRDQTSTKKYWGGWGEKDVSGYFSLHI